MMMSTGYPDSNPAPSITMDLKSVFTLKPSAAGKITFYLTPSNNGVLSIVEGTVGTSVQTLSPLVSEVSGYQRVASPPGTVLYGTIPDTRVQPANYNFGDAPVSTWTAFRTIVAVADVSFTGSSMMDAGSVVVGTVGSKLAPKGTATLNYSVSKSMQVALLDSTRAGNFGAVAGLAGSISLPARKNFRVRCVAPVPEYSRVQPLICTDTDGMPLGYARPIGITGDFPCPVYDPATPWKVIDYSGLDASASITVCIRHCVEYCIDDDSSVAPFASPSPATNKAEQTWQQKFAAAVPTVEQVLNVATDATAMYAQLNNILTGSGTARYGH